MSFLVNTRYEWLTNVLKRIFNTGSPVLAITLPVETVELLVEVPIEVPKEKKSEEVPIEVTTNKESGSDMEEPKDDMNKWRDIFRIICSKCDFRNLLLLKRVNKKLLELVDLEIKNRNRYISPTGDSFGNGFYSDASFWYLGRVCPGFSILDRTALNKYDGFLDMRSRHDAVSRTTAIYPCSKWEEITLFGEKRFCRACLTLKTLKSKEEANTYAAYEHKLRVEREAQKRRERFRLQKQDLQNQNARLKFQPKNK